MCLSALNSHRWSSFVWYESVFCFGAFFTQIHQTRHSILLSSGCTRFRFSGQLDEVSFLLYLFLVIQFCRLAVFSAFTLSFFPSSLSNEAKCLVAQSLFPDVVHPYFLCSSRQLPFVSLEFDPLENDDNATSYLWFSFSWWHVYATKVKSNKVVPDKNFLYTIHLFHLSLFPQKSNQAGSFSSSDQNALCQSSPWFAFFVNLGVKRNRRSGECRGAAGNLQGHWQKSEHAQQLEKESKPKRHKWFREALTGHLSASWALGWEFHFLNLEKVLENDAKLSVFLQHSAVRKEGMQFNLTVRLGWVLHISATSVNHPKSSASISAVPQILVSLCSPLKESRIDRRPEARRCPLTLLCHSCDRPLEEKSKLSQQGTG